MCGRRAEIHPGPVPYALNSYILLGGRGVVRFPESLKGSKYLNKGPHKGLVGTDLEHTVLGHNLVKSISHGIDCTALGVRVQGFSFSNHTSQRHDV